MSARLFRWFVLLPLLGAWVAAQAAPTPPVDPQRARWEACPAIAIPEMTEINDAIERAALPFVVSTFMVTEVGGCDVKEIWGAGTASPDQIRAVLQVAGFSGPINLNPPPEFVKPTNKLKLTVQMPIKLKQGQNLKVKISFHNPLSETRELTWGYDPFRYLVLDISGRPVRWNQSTMEFLPLSISNCPALSACSHTLDIDVPLNHFNPHLSLEPGQYLLRLQTDDLSFGGQVWNETLPDIPFEVVP